jgi:predicted ester cyclase
VSVQQTRNKRIVERLYLEVGNEGRLEVLDEIARPDHVEHRPFPGQTQGVEGLKQRMSMVRSALDPTFTIEHLIAEGDEVAVMWSNRCEHLGEWLGFSPTGKSFTVHGVDIHLLRDGRLAEHWDVVDISEFLATVGAMPDPSTGG